MDQAGPSSYVIWKDENNIFIDKVGKNIDKNININIFIDRAAKSIRTWELSSQKILRLGRTIFSKVLRK